MNVYTKRGDGGETSLYSGERVAKCSPRVNVYGTVDEVQALLGLARAFAEQGRIANTLLSVEVKLVDVMAELATIGGKPRVTAADVEELEETIDCYSVALPSGFVFKVPGASKLSASLHLTRTVVRRLERGMVEQRDLIEASDELMAYINRLSDLCYVMARYADEVTDDEANDETGDCDL